MSALTTLARTETRLFLRDPGSLLIAVLLPTALLAGLGAVPALREPTEFFGGVRFVDYFVPALLAISITQLGLQTLPAVLATYRERGILRRYSATPMSPAAVLVVQLLINLAATAVAILLLVAVAVLGFGVAVPQHPVGFVLAVLLGTSAVFSIGLVIAAVAPRSRTAAGIGGLAVMVALLFSGTYLPKFLLPDAMVRIGEFVPPGAAAVQGAWIGAGPEPMQLVVMALVTAGATVAAAKLFRWE